MSQKKAPEHARRSSDRSGQQERPEPHFGYARCIRNEVFRYTRYQIYEEGQQKAASGIELPVIVPQFLLTEEHVHGIASEDLGEVKRYYSAYDSAYYREQESHSYSKHVACGKLYRLARKYAYHYLEYLQADYEQKCDFAVLPEISNNGARHFLAEHSASVSQIKKSRYARNNNDEQYQLGYGNYSLASVCGNSVVHIVIRPFL